MKRVGPKYQVNDNFYPKKPIPVKDVQGEFIYPWDGMVTIQENKGKQHHKTIVVVVDDKGRVSEEIKAQLYLAKHSHA